jgi:Lamin Tail Domain
MKLHVLLGSMAVTGLSTFVCGDARVVITEIMYNPASEEKRNESEWVEIANVGDQAVEMKGWSLDDEDTSDWSPFTATLEPGAVAVLVNAGSVTEQEFRSAWDSAASAQNATYQVIPVKWGGLANQAPSENETLQLLDSQGKVVCEVNYDTADDWPIVGLKGGPSIWLTDVRAEKLSIGTLWRASVEGEAGARRCATTTVFNEADVGSPGSVENIRGTATPTTPDDMQVTPEQPGQPEQPVLARPENAPPAPKPAPPAGGGGNKDSKKAD